MIEHVECTLQWIHRLEHTLCEVLVITIKFSGYRTESFAVADQRRKLEKLRAEK